MTSDRETLVEVESSFDSGLGFSDENLHRERPVELWAAKRTTMTLNQFSSFAAVAKHLNMTKASADRGHGSGPVVPADNHANS